MYRILLLFSIALLGCTSESPFTEKTCNESAGHMVFKPCRELTYMAKFWDTENNLISESRVWIMATGNAWEFSDRQNELLIAYEFDSTDVERINEYAINKGLNDRLWQKQEATGVIENENQIWMHPFRSNQYNFTEVAPFPSIRLRIEPGVQWSSTLSIYDGWGDWANSTLTNNYEIVGYEEIETPFSSLEAWHVDSYTSAPFGISTHNFWFHHDLGFVKMIIHNYAGQTLQIELIDVKDS
ncbi:hypothetical protein [Ekhidna sp.]|uniref:hypothetical protein n=1 Tax=Ekhidna sp. TaxID=2608089 RepID=UPI003CCC065B